MIGLFLYENVELSFALVELKWIIFVCIGDDHLMQKLV